MADNTSTTKFKADISELKSAMQQAARQVKLANSEFKAATAGMDDWTDSADGLSAKIKQLNTTLNAQRSQLSSLEKQYALVSEEQGENSKGAEELKVKINNQKAAITKTEKQLNSYEQELKDCEDGTGRFADELDDVDDAARNASDGFTVMKGVLANLIATVVTSAISELKDLATEIVEVGSSFEKSMSNVGALSGATEEELKLLSDTAKEFGANTQFSASEAADALSYMALAGWDAKTSTEALGGVLDLAAASGMDLASASDMVTDYMSAFGMEASDSAYFADLLAYAQSNANTTAQGLGEAFRNCAANMNAAGQDVETTTALLSSMANQGLKGSEAGTALTAVMRDLTSKMEDGAIQIGETTVEVQDAEGNFRDLTDILKDVEDATDGMGDAEKSAALMTTFTSDSIKGLNLILNAGVGYAEDFEEQLRNATGTSKEMADTINDNLSGDLTALNSKLEGIKITIYESMAPALRDSVAMISDVLDTVDWEDVGEKLGEVAVKAVDLFTKIIENADGIKDVLTAVGISLGTAFVVSKVAAFASSIITLWQTFQTLKTATEAATVAQQLLNVAQMATPVGLVTAAVAGLAAGLIYLASKTKEASEVTANLTDYEQQEIDKVKELKESYDQLKESRDKEVSAINTEYGYYQELASELDGLVDANGEVKEGYEDRVNFILTTLNDAVGTEMELVDGVIQNYQDEKAAIEDLIETKKAEAILSANEEAYTTAIQGKNEALQNYTTTTGIYKQKLADMEEAQAAYNEVANMTAAEYASLNDLTWDMGTASQMLANEQAALKDELTSAKMAVTDSRQAMWDAEDTYVGYQNTIKNYEGLSSAIISGDTAKISAALANMEYDFQTAESSTRRSLEKQVENYEENLEALKQAIEDGTPGVTQEMVDQAQAMVDAAKEELDKLPAEAEESANDGAAKFAKTLGSTPNVNNVLSNSERLRKAAEEGLEPTGNEETSGQDFTQGYIDGMLYKNKTVKSTAKELGTNAVSALNEGQDSHSPSKATTTSGENFGQGFIDGMSNKESSIWTKAYNLAKQALAALKKGQEEGSPSKLTRRSGVFFGTGYYKGIESTESAVKNTATNLAYMAINTLKTTQKEGSPSKVTELSGVMFAQGYINGIGSMQKKLQTTVKNMTNTALKTAMSLDNYNFSEVAQNAADYLAAEMTNKTSYMINKINYQNSKKLDEYDDEIAKLTAEKEAKLDAYQEKIDDTSVKTIKDQLTAEKKLIEEKYNNLIAAQNKAKAAYQTASSEMINEFTTALNSYSTKAQELINNTINGISDKYQEKYNALIDKQNTLIEKLKGAGDLFEISGAGIMTVNDIQEQTKQIKEYAAKLQKIKSKVSSDLFDQIASYEMKEGNAFMDRLLALSDADLKAYSDAYDEKMSVSESLAEKTYDKDFKNVAKDYQTELKKAFKDLPSQLEEIGNQTMKGFVSGLTENTDYMETEVKEYIAQMIDTFKSELKIKSPSRVTKALGEFTGEGFANGLKDTINNVKKTAQTMAQAVAAPLDGIKSSVSGARSLVNDQNKIGQTNNNVVNNYNLVQNNTSPKSLSALETYQARRQQIALVKAFT